MSRPDGHEHKTQTYSTCYFGRPRRICGNLGRGLPAVVLRLVPRPGLTWISADGPFNEHLVRDVGALYLGLGAASLAAAFSRHATPGRVIGLAWALFGILHFGYHVLHLEGTIVDRIGNIVTLGLALLLGILLVLPSRRTVQNQREVAR